MPTSGYGEGGCFKRSNGKNNDEEIMGNDDGRDYCKNLLKNNEDGVKSSRDALVPLA